MKKILSFFIMLLMPSVTFSQVLTQHFAEGEAVKNGVKVSKRNSSRWDRYLGMTAAMTQVPVPTATSHSDKLEFSGYTPISLLARQIFP